MFLEKNHIIALKLPNWAQAFEVLGLAKLHKCWQNLADTCRYSTYLYLDSPVVPFKSTNLLFYLWNLVLLPKFFGYCTWRVKLCLAIHADVVSKQRAGLSFCGVLGPGMAWVARFTLGSWTTSPNNPKFNIFLQKIDQIGYFEHINWDFTSNKWNVPIDAEIQLGQVWKPHSLDVASGWPCETLWPRRYAWVIFVVIHIPSSVDGFVGIEMDFINRFGVEIPKFRGIKPLFWSI